MSKRIDRVDTRQKLEVRREPYWQRISEGRYIGYRRMTKGSEGTWLARAPGQGSRYAYQTLQGIDDHPEKDRYDAALKAAGEWFRHLDLGGSTLPHTVKAAAESYLERLRAEEGETAASNQEGFLRRLVYDDPIAIVELSDLGALKRECSAWRKRILKRSEARSSFNRNITPLRAALNQAYEDGHVTSRQPWLQALKPLEGADNRRTLYLDRDQRRELVESFSEEARPLFQTLNMLPMRPGEVAGLRVDYLKAGQRALEIPTGKTEPRIVPLTDDMVAHFKQCAKGKLPKAWLVSRGNGGQWDRFAWRDEMKLAAARARAPAATVAYTLRHSLITDLVTGGLDLFHVAQLAGTSILMIQKNYGHLQNEHARKALQKLSETAAV